LLPRWREAVVEGHGDEDVAAAVTSPPRPIRRAVRA
jgi:hypothetical protein